MLADLEEWHCITDVKLFAEDHHDKHRIWYSACPYTKACDPLGIFETDSNSSALLMGTMMIVAISITRVRVCHIV